MHKKAPPFRPPRPPDKPPKYVWWMWHPNNKEGRWYRTSWEFDDKETALNPDNTFGHLTSPYRHHKLILELSDGTMIEQKDIPPRFDLCSPGALAHWEDKCGFCEEAVHLMKQEHIPAALDKLYAGMDSLMSLDAWEDVKLVFDRIPAAYTVLAIGVLILTKNAPKVAKLRDGYYNAVKNYLLDRNLSSSEIESMLYGL